MSHFFYFFCHIHLHLHVCACTFTPKQKKHETRKQIKAIVGLLAYPGLSPNPFSDNNYRWPILVALFPTMFCWFSPYAEYRAWKKEEEKKKVGIVALE
jgi:hypothetical protein